MCVHECVCVSATHHTIMIIDQLVGGEKHKHLGLKEKGETLQNNQTETRRASNQLCFPFCQVINKVTITLIILNETSDIL